MRAWRVGLLIGLWMLGGCFQPERFQVRYYRLDDLTGAVPQAERTLPVTLGIQPLTAATHYRDRILYRISEVEVGFYPFDRWVEPPEEMVTRFLTRVIARSNLFQQVVPAHDIRPQALVLSGEVTRFDELREPAGRRAQCELRLVLRRARDEQLVWAGPISATVALDQATPVGLAAAMTRAVEEVAVKLLQQWQQAGLKL